MEKYRRTEYWHTIDFVKGILIVCVFMGHFIPGVCRETFPRYMIYSFHMPLFIGISGFLINIEKIEINIFMLSKKYWKRLVLPWVVAVVCFFVLNHIKGNISDISIKNIVAAFCHPYYHLWYVIGFISYLSILCLLWTFFKNVKFRWVYIFIIVICISIISKWNLLLGGGY